MRRPPGPARSRWVLVVALVAIAACGPTPAATPSPGASSAGRTGIAGRATAGPVCPVERVPPDPACAARPVAGAVILVTDGSGGQVGQAVTAADGTFFAETKPGDYVVVAQPAAGLLGTPGPQPVAVRAGTTTTIEIVYDTGIR